MKKTEIVATLKQIGITDETHDIYLLVEKISENSQFSETQSIDSIPDDEFWELVAQADYDLREVGNGLYRSEAVEGTKIEAAIVAHIVEKTKVAMTDLKPIAKVIRESGLIDHHRVPDWGSDEWPNHE